MKVSARLLGVPPDASHKPQALNYKQDIENSLSRRLAAHLQLRCKDPGLAHTIGRLLVTRKRR